MSKTHRSVCRSGNNNILPALTSSTTAVITDNSSINSRRVGRGTNWRGSTPCADEDSDANSAINRSTRTVPSKKRNVQGDPVSQQSPSVTRSPLKYRDGSERYANFLLVLYNC